MAQTFHPSFNTISKVSLSAIIGLITLVFVFWAALQRSPYVTEQYVARAQPVPFSHQHHVGGLGLDCRYCHTGVEESSFAGMPATSVCMNCHSQIWTNADVLQPVRDSFKQGEPLRWTRVYKLPDFVYFNHSVHIAASVPCTRCHGNVDEMPIMWKASSLYMEWCLQCHRNPKPYAEPSPLLTSCSTCHR